MPSEFVALKDLARIMGLHPRSVKRWWKRLKVPPTVERNCCHRWSAEDANKFLERWAASTNQNKPA